MSINYGLDARQYTTVMVSIVSTLTLCEGNRNLAILFRNEDYDKPSYKYIGNSLLHL